MPGLDGIAATKRLKHVARTRHIPILVLTGYPTRAIDQGALEAGAQDFFMKSQIEARVLARAILRVCLKKRP